MILTLTLKFFAGALLGVGYFAALWWSVRHAVEARRGGGFLFVSFLLRIGLLSAAIVWLMDGRLAELAAVMVGFLVVRLIAVRRTRAQGPMLGHGGGERGLDGASAEV